MPTLGNTLVLGGDQSAFRIWGDFVDYTHLFSQRSTEEFNALLKGPILGKYPSAFGALPILARLRAFTPKTIRQIDWLAHSTYPSNRLISP